MKIHCACGFLFTVWPAFRMHLGDFLRPLGKVHYKRKTLQWKKLWKWCWTGSMSTGEIQPWIQSIINCIIGYAVGPPYPWAAQYPWIWISTYAEPTAGGSQTSQMWTEVPSSCIWEASWGSGRFHVASSYLRRHLLGASGFHYAWNSVLVQSGWIGSETDPPWIPRGPCTQWDAVHVLGCWEPWGRALHCPSKIPLSLHPDGALGPTLTISIKVPNLANP